MLSLDPLASASFWLADWIGPGVFLPSPSPCPGTAGHVPGLAGGAGPLAALAAQLAAASPAPAFTLAITFAAPLGLPFDAAAVSGAGAAFQFLSREGSKPGRQYLGTAADGTAAAAAAGAAADRASASSRGAGRGAAESEGPERWVAVASDGFAAALLARQRAAAGGVLPPQTPAYRLETAEELAAALAALLEPALGRQVRAVCAM